MTQPSEKPLAKSVIVKTDGNGKITESIVGLWNGTRVRAGGPIQLTVK